VSTSTLTYQARNYTVSTSVYEGPLDLLLQLIERAELDITKLALAQVTDQYLIHLHALEEQSPNDVSAFLVIAARLLQIKSEALLPKPPIREPGEEDPGESLVEHLKAYKRYKQIAKLLSERESKGMRTYLRIASPPQITAGFDLGDLEIEQLLLAARRALLKEEKPGLASVVSVPKITIREKIALIKSTLHGKQWFEFYSIIRDIHSRIEIVVTFLAILELVKRNLLLAQQRDLFGEIILEKANLWDEETEIELEFGE